MTSLYTKKKISGDGSYYIHFTDEDTKIQKASNQWWNQDLYAEQSDSNPSYIDFNVLHLKL